MLEGFIFGIGFWLACLVIGIAAGLVCLMGLFASYLAKGRKEKIGRASEETNVVNPGWPE